MFSQEELDRLVDAMRASGITTLDVKGENDQLRLVLPPVMAPAVPLTENPQARCLPAKSPSIGTFLPRGGEDGLPVLERGAAVSEGEVLGYVCQGPVRALVTTPATGVLTGESPVEGALVGYGDTLFAVEIEP